MGSEEHEQGQQVEPRAKATHGPAMEGGREAQTCPDPSQVEDRGRGQCQPRPSSLWSRMLWALFDWTFERKIGVGWDEGLYPLESGLAAKQKAQNNAD